MTFQHEQKLHVTLERLTTPKLIEEKQKVITNTQKEDTYVRGQSLST